MSSSPPLPAASQSLRSNSLAVAFQDVITVILRVKFRVQRASDAVAFRASMGKMISAAVQEVRRLGYSDQTSQMALYAIVGFLDESVLSSQDPVFQDWARRPLQEEMFGGAFAGEYFFRHVNELLNQPDTQEAADVLELHALCLLLGYRGKFAFGETGEIANIVRRIREKIVRTRGPLMLCRVREEQAPVAAPSGDPWIKRLVLTTAALAVLAIVAFAACWFLLSNSLSGVQASLIQPTHAASALAFFLGGAR